MKTLRLRKKRTTSGTHKGLKRVTRICSLLVMALIFVVQVPYLESDRLYDWVTRVRIKTFLRGIAGNFKPFSVRRLQTTLVVS